MSINQRNVSVSMQLLLLLLLLSITAVGSVPSGFGQNTSPNITTSDIVDLFDNETNKEGGGGEEEERGDNSNFPQLNDDNDNNNSNSSSSSTSISSSPSSSTSSPSSSSPPSLTTSQTAIMINEIELNPPGEYDEGKEWIELYNPSDEDINIGNFEISTLSESATIELPPDAIIEAGETYVIELEEQILSNTVDSLVLANAAGDILDRTPSLIDRSDDDRTWQRVPDGNNEWQFVENTKGNSNGDDSDTGITTLDSEENTQSNANGDDSDALSTILDSVYSESDAVECLGSADCIEGVATRIVDGDTLYVRANSSAIYKVDLALTDAPSRSEEGFVESTEFTRDLCLGSTVLVDEDDMLPTSGSDMVGVVYCSSTNLNSELLDNGYAELETEQCTTSEFANEPWAKDYGC
ncbi:MAG: lamin tail domain-containing protein [Thermoproteota archaeon]|nr:lamin tail domain-containing protein [Thermoproteota archaeon]